MLKKYHIIFIIAVLGLNACSPTKRLVEGEYLLEENVLHTNGIKLSKEDFQEIIKQQPNRMILPFTRFHLHMYNLPSDQRLEMARSRKESRLTRKNKRRIAKGKDPKEGGRTKWEWIKEVVGEPPVIVDSFKVKDSSQQLSTYLVKKGYFQNHVRDSIVYSNKRKSATVHYIMDWEAAYHIDSLSYRISDPLVERYIREEQGNSMLHIGDRFDVDVLSEERDRLNWLIKNRGFFRFTKEHIEFEVDSSSAERTVSIVMIVKPGDKEVIDSLQTSTHTRFTIGNIFFNYDLPEEVVQPDTALHSGYHFIGASTYPLKLKVLAQNTFLKPGMLYSQEKVELTYRRLSALSVLGHVAIRFVEYDDLLDVFITLSPARRQTFSIESQGTNSGGFLGIEGDLVYRHKNIFKGSETMELRMEGGVQAQALITESSGGSGGLEAAENIQLNTLEFGPSLSFRFPKFLLPVSQEKFSKSAQPSTVLLASYNYQDRPDFTRSLSSLTFGYEWKETVKKSHLINPLELSVIRIDKSADFQERLDELNDRFLSDSYQDHFITATRYTFTYNGQNDPKFRNIFYFRGHAELGGNLLRAVYSLSDQPKDSLGSYEIFGIRFANYAKTNLDARFYRVFDDKRMLAARFSTGLGVPLENLGVLPFSKSFFGGGANGLRAWRSRTIGPGGYFEPVVTFDKIGDVQIEANVEYRFNLVDYLDGAFFMDAGNIWLLNPDELRPQGDFAFERFMSEVAVGAGFGLRVDFSYFLLRFDFASQLKDPALAAGERWIFQPKKSYNDAIDEYNSSLEDGESHLKNYRMRWNFNLGIGYPF